MTSIVEAFNNFILAPGSVEAVTREDVGDMMHLLVAPPYDFLFQRPPLFELSEQEIKESFNPAFPFYVFNAPQWAENTQDVFVRNEELVVACSLCANKHSAAEIIDEAKESILEGIAVSIEMNILDADHGIPNIKYNPSFSAKDINDRVLSFNSQTGLNNDYFDAETGTVLYDKFPYTIYVNDFLPDNTYVYLTPNSYAVSVTLNSIECKAELRWDTDHFDKFWSYRVSVNVTTYVNMADELKPTVALADKYTRGI